jgi:hypothetical protein
MSAPVTNQAYSQQNNQLFDWAKTATPQQIEAAKQGLPKDSPLLLAIGMGVQYQQQARAPHPQAPQKTVMEQKLGEFAQTSPQGLPSVGGNQMAMQQVDPMRGAGIGVAPENTSAPQQAATGGLVALAHGGEVRHFVEGGPLAGLKNLNVDPNDPNLETKYAEEVDAGNLANTIESLGGNVSTDSIQYGDNKYAKERAKDTRKKLLTEAEDKREHPEASSAQGIASLPGGIYVPSDISKLSEYLTPKGSKVDPNSYDADAAMARMLNKFTTPKYREERIGKHDVVQKANPTSSAARNEAAPTAKGETYTSADTDAAIAEIARLRGPEADISEEVAAAKEATANARRDKGLMALTQGIGGMLSAQTPYMSQALGAGLLSGVSGYQSGAKDEAAAEKEQRVLQMAQKKANLAGHREATDIWLAQNAEQQKAEAAARVKAADLREARITDLMKGQQTAEYARALEQTKIGANFELEGLKHINTMDKEGYVAYLKEIAAAQDPQTKQQLITSLASLAKANGGTADDVYKDIAKFSPYVFGSSQGAAKPFTKLGNMLYTPPAQ